MNPHHFSLFRRRFVSALFALVISAFTTAAWADPSSTDNDEIAHLLKFVETSEAAFLRNGDSHTAVAAAKHIEAKRDHYQKKISNAEDFVRLSATKSALSGKIYHVKLKDGTKVATSKWLLGELTRYRQAKVAAVEKVKPVGAE